MLLVPPNRKFGSIQFPSNFTRPRTYQRVSALNAFVSGLRNRRITIGFSGHFSFRGRSKDQWDNPTPISIKNLGIRAKNEETNKESKAKSKTSMGRLFIETLRGPKIFKCRFCKVDSASHDAIVSKDFQGRYGKAYLFRNVVNISLGPIEERHLISGLHTVNDIYCSSCQQILGWRYEKAYEPSQKYKEGKYILERDRILKESW